MKRILFLLLLLSAASLQAAANIADKVVRANVAGIDLLAYPTGVDQVVTFRGSLPAGDSFAGSGNVAIPTLVGEMLDEGTAKQDKFAIAQKLDNLGARIRFSVGGVMLEFGGKCLRKDLPEVIAILAEELRTPAFHEAEFAKAKKQLAGQMQRALENPDFRAGQAFAEAAFPVGHPNYTPPTKEFIAAIQSATLEEVKQFYAQHYGPAKATLVVVGDVDVKQLQEAVAQNFAGWNGGVPVPDFPAAPLPNEQKEQVIPMPDKPNVSVVIGQPSGMKYTDPDALALRLGTTVLGRGFTGRLMSTVRDKEGLTYGIGAGLSADSFATGTWQIGADFAPELLENGLASTRRELDKWYRDGITAAELERVKTYLVGSFKVGLATTDGLASTLLEAIHRGLDPSWLDQYPGRIEQLSLAEVNGAIKKHLAPEKMIVIKAGTVPAPPAP